MEEGSVACPRGHGGDFAVEVRRFLLLLTRFRKVETVSASNLGLEDTSMRHGRRGFTLIELLVVIAIIAILAAILFPVFAQAREKARQSACMSNVKQIGMAVWQYAQDWDESNPGVWFGPVSGSPWSQPSNENIYYKWMDAVYPYVKNEQIFNCPSDGANKKYVFRNRDKSNGYGSYAMSQAYFKVGDAFTGPASDYNQFITSGNPFVMRIAMIQRPADTVWIVDGGMKGVRDPDWKSYEFWWYDPAEINRLYPTPKIGATGQRHFQNIVERHSDLVNVIYCDGHAKAVKLDRLTERKPVGNQQIMTAFTIEDD
jgi:prepilin-type N-terminal cleavage/methylation domain-containing protein/prepilin-type processing-associated H-X9-DG protein